MKRISASLQGYSIYLAVLNESDLEKVYRWKNDFQLAALIKAHPFPVSRGEVEEWFKRSQSDKTQVLFGIYLGRDHGLIGIVRLMFIDWISSNAELGIYLGDRGCRRKGFGKEATRLVLDYAFETLNLKRVYLRVLKTNRSAINLYRSVGFKREGVLRKAFWTRGRCCDVVMMGMLKKEYGK